MIRGLAVYTTTAVVALFLAIGGVAAGGAQAASNAGIDAPRPLEESTNVVSVKSEFEYPVSPVSQQNAVRKAEDYLDYTALSRSGLINQLVEFEGFTPAQAEYGVATTGL